MKKIPGKCATDVPHITIIGHFLVLATSLILSFCPAIAVADDKLDAAFDKDVLVIEASAHACHRIDIYVATSNRQRSRGLMFVRSLPPMSGMLFIYDREDYASIWMNNTYIPLDILFVRRDGRISSIARNTEPLSLQSITSVEPIAYVLELNAGTAERLFIDEKSRLMWGPTHQAPQ